MSKHTPEHKEFRAEQRYYVIKRKHLKNGYDEGRVINLLNSLDLPDLECVIVESDWPMYADVWSMIQQYIETGKHTSIEKLQRQNAELLEALYKALPFVEDCADDECYKPNHVKAVLNQVNDAIAKAKGEA